MTVTVTLPKQIPLSTTGSLMAGAKLYSYLTATSTPQDLYSDYALTTPLSNPVVADGNGVFPVMFYGTTNRYRLDLKTAADVSLSGYPIDNMGPDTAVSLGAAKTSSANVFTADQKISEAEVRWLFDETDAGADKRLWDIDIQAGVFKLRTRTDADGSGKDILTVTRGTTTAVGSIAIGNATDLAPVTIYGAVTESGASGSFTGTLVGCTTSPTATFNWVRSGNLVTVDCNLGLSATSNSTSLSITGAPALLTPARGQSAPCIVKDNAGSYPGVANVSGGTISYGLYSPAQANFTNSGTKGIPSNHSFTYSLT
jgi:hypothetical protein